jgi:Flagellar hook-length control protein FliK
MDKSGNQIGVNPLTRISPLTAVASIGDPAQALESRAEQMTKQHAGLLAKMAVMEIKSLPDKTASTASVSATAKLIDQSLQQAEAKGIAEKYIAQTPITHNPKLPNIVSQQLKAAISNSGLFYESHLREFVEGNRHLTGIKQEPQNQFHNLAQALLPQQLHILEHQRLSWHGEAWPNQLMDWDVYLQNKQENKDNHTQASEEQTSIASDLTLHLPHLGKVTAKISLKNGRMHVGILAEQKASLQLLRERSSSLASAIESSGQKLEGLTLEALTNKDVIPQRLVEVQNDG